MVAEKDLKLYQFLYVFETTNLALSIIANLFLIYLIIYRSSKEIGAYRFMLIAFAINDIYYCIVHYLTHPVICSYRDAFIMFSHGLLTSKLSICVYASSFSQTMPLLAHLFTYRLIATKFPHFLEFYSGRNITLLLIGTLAGEFTLWFLNCWFYYDSDAHFRAYVQPFLDAEFDGDGSEFIGALYYSVEGTFQLRAFLATMGFNSIMGICGFIILFCSITIMKHLGRKDIQWSEKTKAMQHQLFYTLLVQARTLMIIPMIFVYSPCAGIINLPMLGFHVNVFPNVVTASVSMYPIIDALIVMLGVKNYRHTLLTFFRHFHRSNVTLVSSVAHEGNTRTAISSTNK